MKRQNDFIFSCPWHLSPFPLFASNFCVIYAYTLLRVHNPSHCIFPAAESFFRELLAKKYQFLEIYNAKATFLNLVSTVNLETLLFLEQSKANDSVEQCAVFLRQLFPSKNSGKLWTFLKHIWRSSSPTVFFNFEDSFPKLHCQGRN